MPVGNGVTPDDLVGRARSSTGLTDLGSDHFRDYLAAWCADLASPRLSDSGRARLATIAVRNLETRLRVEDTLRRHPEILDVRLPRIVRIAGFPRSGTTLLHNLLTLRAGRRALLRWELVAPVPPPEASTYRTDPRIEKIAKPLDALRGTALERMHWVEATDPEECTWGFTDLSGLLGRGCVSAMPNWAGVVNDGARDRRPTYVEYRRLVQLLLWRNPLGRDGTLVLKSPTDTDCLRTFLDVFPEAAIVQLHRDPFRTVTSVCEVAEIVCRPYLAEGTSFPDDEMRANAVALHTAYADAMVELIRSSRERVVNARYADLMSAPAAVVADVERQLGLPEGTASTDDLVTGYLERQRAGMRAAPPKDYRSFGATPELVHGEPSLARYMATFDVPEERQRTTAPVG